MAYLWITRWPPYAPLKGGDIDYSRHLIASLAECHPVHGLAYAAPGITPAPHPHVTWTLLDGQPNPPKWASLVSHLPNVAFRNSSKAFLVEAIKAARQADAVFVDFIGMFWCVAELAASLRSQPGAPPIIVIDHNYEYAIRRQMAEAEQAPVMKRILALDAWKAGRLERAANDCADGLAANTDADCKAFATITGTAAAVITPGYAGRRLPPRSIGPQTSRRICILGHHAAHHKKMVLANVLQALAVHGVERQCVIDVIGDGDNTEFETKFPGFNYLGYVEDLEAYLSDVRFGLISDEIGGGFKHRALMHAFYRVPIVAVHRALAGMGFVPGEHYVGARTVEDVARAIPVLLDDFPLLNTVQDGAYRLCETAYDWMDRGQDLHRFVTTLRIPKSG